MMLIKDLQVGLYEANCYIVTDEDSLECAVIDPGDVSNMILDYLEEHKLTCKYIFLTHGHFDHVTAAASVSEETGAPVYIHAGDICTEEEKSLYCFPAQYSACHYKEGDSFSVGKLVFEVLETPGHSLGSVTLRCGQALFTGDTLFRDSYGRTDLPGGNATALRASLSRLNKLEGDYEVYPGHMAVSSLERERRYNPYMKNNLE